MDECPDGRVHMTGTPPDAPSCSRWPDSFVCGPMLSFRREEMRIAKIAATLVLVAPVLLSAQTPSSSTKTRVYSSANGSVAQPAETVYVKGTVSGTAPSGANYVITGSKSTLRVDTVFTAKTSTTAESKSD